MNTLSIIILTIVLTTSIIGLFFLVWQFNKTIRGLTERVKKLETANRLRLPHKAALEAINAMAALDALEQEADFKRSLIENAKGHIQNFIATGTNREK